MDAVAVTRAIDLALDESRAEDAAETALEFPLLPSATLHRVHDALRGHDPRLRSQVGQALAHAAVREQRYEDALDAQTRCLADAQEAGDEWLATVAEATGAMIAWRLGADDASDALFGAAAERGYATSDASFGYVLGMLGARHLERGEPEPAIALLTDGIELARDGVPAGTLAHAQRLLARAYLLAGRRDEAGTLLAVVLRAATVDDDRGLLCPCLDTLAELTSAVGRHADAQEAIALSDRLRRDPHNPRAPHEQAALDGILRPERASSRVGEADAGTWALVALASLEHSL